MRSSKFIPQTTVSLEDLLSVIPEGASDVKIHNALGIKPSDNDGISVSWEVYDDEPHDIYANDMKPR